MHLPTPLRTPPGKKATHRMHGSALLEVVDEDKLSRSLPTMVRLLRPHQQTRGALVSKR